MTRDRCPLCGGLNACAMSGEGPAPNTAAIRACWCMQARIDPDLLQERLRAASTEAGKACICPECAAALARKAMAPSA